MYEQQVNADVAKIVGCTEDPIPDFVHSAAAHSKYVLPWIKENGYDILFQDAVLLIRGGSDAGWWRRFWLLITASPFHWSEALILVAIGLENE